MKKAIALCMILSLPISTASALDMKIDSYMVVSDYGLGTFSVRRSTFTERIGAVVGISYSVSTSKDGETYTFSSEAATPAKRYMPSATAIKVIIRDDLKAKEVPQRAAAYFAERLSTKRREQKAGASALSGATLRVP